METRANYAIIGIFTLAVIAAAFGFVFWFSGTDSGAKRTAYKIEFSSSVAGLTKGAAVLFNGIRVGEVMDVYFDVNVPSKAFARIEVQPDTPVRVNTKAALDVQLLSGAAVVALNGGTADQPKLEKEAGQDLPTIVAERGGIGSLLETARNTADEATRLLVQINELVDRNKGTINTTLANVQVFSKALADNAPAIDGFLKSVGEAATRIGPLAAKLETLTDETTSLIRAVEPARVNRIVRNVEDLTQTIADNRDRVAAILTTTNELVDQLRRSTPKLDALLDTAATAAAAIPPLANKLGSLSDDGSRLVRAIDPQQVSRIVANVDSVVATVNDGRERVAEVFRNTASLTQRLNDAVPKLDSILDTVNRAAPGLDTLLTTATGAAASIAPAAQRISALADEAGSLVRSVDRTQVTRIVANVDGLMATVNDNRERVGEVLRNTASLTGRLNESAPKLDGLLTTLARVAENLNPLSAKLSTLTDAVAVRVQAINPDDVRQVVAGAFRFVDGLAAVTPETQQTIRNANELTAKLNRSADRIDGLIKSAQDFLGSAAGQEGKSTFQAVREAALAFQKASENLDRRATQIAEGVTRFSGSGSRVVESLGADARRAVNNVGRAAANLEKNPSSVIFGSGRAGIPTFNGR